MTVPSPPILVGAVGGSGTRVVGQLLREAGVQLGGPTNKAGDALNMRPLYLDHVAPYWRGGLDEAALQRDLARLLAVHLETLDPCRPWGWKNPSSLYLLPVLDRMLPGLRFVHVIRHGLDMVTSDNQNPLRKFGAAVLGSRWRDLPRPLASALLWARANTLAADYGSTMGRRYFLLRYEDLCADHDGVMAELALAFGLPVPESGWRTGIRPGIPRWPGMDPALREGLVARIGPVLKRFGYAC